MHGAQPGLRLLRVSAHDHRANTFGSVLAASCHQVSIEKPEQQRVHRIVGDYVPTGFSDSAEQQTKTIYGRLRLHRGPTRFGGRERRRRADGSDHLAQIPMHDPRAGKRLTGPFCAIVLREATTMYLDLGKADRRATATVASTSAPATAAGTAIANHAAASLRSEPAPTAPPTQAAFLAGAKRGAAPSLFGA